MKRLFLIVASLVLIGTRPVSAQTGDKVEKKNGQILYGRVIEETSDGIRFEPADALGGVVVFQIPKSQIRSITREVREGPGYCVIQISGEIGKDVTADAFRQALAVAGRFDAKYIILSFDSPGGSIQERHRLLEAMRDTKEFQYVAHVKRAMSAAAVIALACPKIFMQPEGTIGAAEPVAQGHHGEPEGVGGKIRRAILGTQAGAAGRGGRPQVLIV